MRTGFTLIEMLVVVVIIAILASLVALGVNHAMTSSKISMTEATLGALGHACNQYRLRTGDFPPSTLADRKIGVRNATNNGIEAMVACLSSQKGGGVLYMPGDEAAYGNADGDDVSEADRKKIDWYFGDNKLRELKDIFGFTLTYVHHRDYRAPRGEILKYKLVEKGDDVTIRVERSADTSAFVQPDSFQLRSAGPDGRWGTGDDIRR